MGEALQATQVQPPHGLSEAQVEVIRAVLRPFADRIALVGLFGSRATGAWRPESDIDLVLYGPLPEADIDRIRTLLTESNLPMRVDVCSYERLDGTSLRAHIDRVMQPLFRAGFL